LVRRAVAQLG